jgi:hypothetical protein
MMHEAPKGDNVHKQYRNTIKKNLVKLSLIKTHNSSLACFLLKIKGGL